MTIDELITAAQTASEQYGGATEVFIQLPVGVARVYDATTEFATPDNPTANGEMFVLRP